MKTCANCGAVAEASATQCERCGMQLPDAVSAPAVPAAGPLGGPTDGGARVLRGLELAISVTLMVAGGALVATGTLTTVGWVLIVLGALVVVGFRIF